MTRYNRHETIRGNLMKKQIQVIRPGRKPADKCKRGHDLTNLDNVFYSKGENYVNGIARKCRLCRNIMANERNKKLRLANPKSKLIKTHCAHGHELFGDNLYTNPNTKKRACRKCHVIAELKYQKLHKEKFSIYHNALRKKRRIIRQIDDITF